MDTTDTAIFFDSSGVCNHCLRYDELKKQVRPREREFSLLVDQIIQRGKNYPYDCIAAVSGGTDSSFMLHQLKQSGLRILVVHYDSGWNTEEAVHNLKVLTGRMGLELYTCGVDPEEFRDVQLAYLKAGVVDLDVPTDHALYGSLFRAAVLKKAPYILTGHNMATEYIRQIEKC